MRWFILTCCLILAPWLVAEQLSIQESRRLDAIQDAVAKAGASYTAGDFQSSGKQIAEAIRQVDEATRTASDALYDRLLPAKQRIEKAHTMLELEGVALPPLRWPARPSGGAAVSSSKPQSGRSPASRPPNRPTARPVMPVPLTPMPVAPPPITPPTAGVSFVSAVAPILVGRCGRCHVSDDKGGFSAASYSALMKGPPEGVVVFAGDVVGSRLIETIETGEMPRGGAKLMPQELQTLKSWILEGAKFDGSDPQSPLAAASPSTTVPAAQNLEVVRASGTESVSFAGDVAPLLVGSCIGCHIDAMQNRGGLRMDTFAQLLRGGDSGPMIVPGKGAESLLVKKLRGMVGDRMPAGGRSPLTEESVQLISTWIDEGATLDGVSPTQPVRVMSQLAWAATAAPTELSQRRGELARANLTLVTASTAKVETKETEHFLVTGPVSASTLELVARLAEHQMDTVRTVVKAPSGDPFFRGKATIFVFPKRYEYSEFARMVESRSVPAEWTSHWNYDGIDAYASLVCGDQDAESIVESRLAAPLVSLAVATRGRDIPRWFAEGTGAAVAYRATSNRDREARRKQDEAVYAALASMENGKQFLEGKLSPAHSDRIGSAIAATILDRTFRRGFDLLIKNLEDGKAFDQAFEASFRATPAAFVDAWIRRVRGS